MTAQKRKKRKNNRKNTGAGVIVALCIIGIVLIFAANSGVDLPARLEEIWNNTVNSVGGPSQNSQASKLADLESHPDSLLLYILSTGNSDCMLVRTPDGHSMLVDAADSDDARQIASTLRSLGVEKLDAAVATHPDADHIGAMGAVIAEFRPDAVYMPNIGKDTASYWNMMDAIRDAGIEETYAHASMEFALGSATVQVLSPPDTALTDVNDASIVLLVTYGEIKILLTADAEEAALAEMMAQYGDLLDADVLKVGHHGSYTSTSQELLDAVSPQLAFVTAGENNDYGHPHKHTLQLLEQNGVQTLRTDQDGDIAIFTDGSQVAYAVAA